MKTLSAALLGLAAVVVAGCTTTSVAQTPNASVEIEVTAGPADAASPRVKVTYRGVGEGIVQFRLPEGSAEMAAYRGLDARFDGKDAEFRFDGLDNPLMSRVVRLKAGETATMDVALGDIYVIPAGWRLLELTPTGSHAPMTGEARTVRIEAAPTP